MNNILNFILANFGQILSLLLSIILIFLVNKEKKYWLLIFLLFFVIYFGFATFKSYLQFTIWKNHPISKYLLPPYQPISYFLSYSYHHFYKDFVWRLVGAFLVFLIIYTLNKLFKETLFYYEEYYMVTILTALIDFPLNFLLLITGLLMIFMWHIVGMVKKSSTFSEKISFKNYWVFLCIFFIIINIITKNNLHFVEAFKP
jgi:hypothetical protein